MCDGTAHKHKGLTLCTDCFSMQDVVLLMNVLLIKYNIFSSINKSKGLPRIYISRKEMVKLRKVVDDYIIPFSIYKITGKNAKHKSK